MNARIMIINGPNLNLLGAREVEIYGVVSLKQIEESCKTHVEKHNQKAINTGHSDIGRSDTGHSDIGHSDTGRSNKWSVEFRQSNAEGAMVDMLQEARANCQAIVINPAAYGHTSIALRDALIACSMPKVEVHLSNVYKREVFRQSSLSAAAVDGVIMGFGASGYLLAIDAVIEKVENTQ